MYLPLCSKSLCANGWFFFFVFNKEIKSSGVMVAPYSSCITCHFMYFLNSENELKCSVIGSHGWKLNCITEAHGTGHGALCARSVRSRYGASEANGSDANSSHSQSSKISFLSSVSFFADSYAVMGGGILHMSERLSQKAFRSSFAFHFKSLICNHKSRKLCTYSLKNGFNGFMIKFC